MHSSIPLYFNIRELAYSQNCIACYFCIEWLQNYLSNAQRVRRLLLRYKIAPIFSRICLRQKIGLCVQTSVREKIGVTSSNNGTSPIIVTHNSSDKKSVCVR